MEFLRSRLITDRTSATEVHTVDLPIHPISHLILAISGYQMTDEATLAEILAFLNSVKVTRGGVTVLNLESEDLYALNCYLYRRSPTLTNSITTDNATRTLGLIIPFGRTIYDPDECLPAMEKGENQVTLDLTALGTSIDNGIINLDCVQIIGATPKQYLRSTLKTLAAPGGTGDYLQDLPIGNRIAAMQLRMTTFPATSSHAYGVDAVSVLIDEKEKLVASAGVEALVAERMFRASGPITSMLLQQQTLPLNIAWVDFDPRGDSNYLLDTSGAKKAQAKLTYGVNEALYLSTFELVNAA